MDQLLTNLRTQIDEIDCNITKLFNQRMKVSGEIAQIKKDNELPVINRAREREVLCKAVEQSDDDMESYIKILYYTLFDLSRSYQNRLFAQQSSLTENIKNAIESTSKQFPKKATVACQGVDGAYSQQAADRFFSLPGIMNFRTFEGVFQAVESGLCKYGVLPIENSTAGSVNQVYDMMKHYKFYIAKSLRLRIDHCLLTKPGTKMENITEVYSHDQAISQCDHFFKSNPDVRVTICENTAIAAKLVAESDRNDVAAISSRECAGLYDLCVISDDVQNNKNNYTRFICISKEMEIYPGSNKTSIMLLIPHKPGSLYNVIAKFASCDMNLTKLESRPVPGKDFEFLFYFDMEGSIYDPSVITLISELSNDYEQFTYLGSYSEMV